MLNSFTEIFERYFGGRAVYAVYVLLLVLLFWRRKRSNGRVRTAGRPILCMTVTVRIAAKEFNMKREENNDYGQDPVYWRQWFCTGICR